MKSCARLLVAWSLVGLAACSLRPSHPAPIPGYDGDTPIVQIREFPHSSTVTVVAWSPAEDGYGLRAQLRRGDGSLVRDHQLYLSTYAGVYLSAFPLPRGARAYVLTVVPTRRMLLYTGTYRDDWSCFDGPPCSPREVKSVRVPDELLRANRDSVIVRFYTFSGGELLLTLPHDLINAYLKAVDSVAFALAPRRAASSMGR